MMMKLKQILKGIPGAIVKGSKEVSILGISANSKLISPDNLFIAKKGKVFDGSQFIPEAIRGGAAAVITDLYDPTLKNIVQVIHPDVAAIEGMLAANFYRHPSQELLVVGITGTNGKTTTSFIVKNLLDSLLGPCGLIGTIEYIIGNYRYPATRTTPDVSSNHKMLREMVSQGCRSAVMEVTSHALDQRRVDCIEYDVAIFSNLTLDHLDYHGTMENYGNAKKKLFDRLGKERKKKKGATAIVNRDSPWSALMTRDCSAAILSYGIDNPADIRAHDIRYEGDKTLAMITFRGETIECSWPFVGRFNVYNCLSAMGVALSQGETLQKVGSLMSQIPHVRGRLEPVENNLGLKIFVDFAHSDDALKNVIEILNEARGNKGRLLVVFGCGGDRDRLKRPKMGEVCGHFADYSVITSDNPRTEDPEKICEEIAQGFPNRDCYEIEIDRRRAIEKAIKKANPDDIILIAGKGHEAYQIFAHKTIDFDDVKIAASVCNDLQESNKK